MASYDNTSGGALVLPDGTEIKAGASADVSADIMAIPGVSQWVDEGKFTPSGEFPLDAPASRIELIREAISGLDPEKDYTKGGKPEVDAINALMPEGSEPVTAAERDAALED